MSKRVILAFLLGIFLISSVSALISFSEPKSLYSIGDELSLNVTLKPLQGANGFFSAVLRCDGASVEIYRMPYDSKTGQSTSFPIKATLDRGLIGLLDGECYVEGKYDDEKISSSKFLISSEIIVTLDVQGNIFEPNDKLSLSGSAFLKNGQPVDGIAIVEVAKNNLIYQTPVSAGRFSFDFDLPQNTASGGYNLDVRISHRDSLGNTLNSGNASTGFKVKQVVNAIEVALSNVSVKPGADIKYQIVLYDQVLIRAVQDVSVKLINALGDIVVERNITSGTDSNYFAIGNQYAPGLWTVQASIGSLTGNKTFTILELKNISIVKENSTLLITNIGNVIYDTPINIRIGETDELVSLNLQPGEEKRLRVFAPDGDYDLSTTSGDQSQSFGTTFLTGSAIRVSDPSEIDVARFKTVFWIILLLVLIFLLYRVYRKFRRNREFVSSSSSSPSVSKSPVRKQENVKDESFIWKSSSAPQPKTTRSFSDMQRQQTLMKTEDFGKKEECTVVALKVKNYDEIAKYKGTESALDTLVRAAGLARSAKAQVSREDKFTIMIFSQTATGDKNPHLKAARIAKEIEALLKAHNRKYARKISFGLGIATAEMVVEKRGKEIQHTSVGTIIPTAKKIAEHAHDSLLLHNSTHDKLRGQIKSDKGIGGMHWAIQSFIEREQHTEFLKKFMERRADESNSF